MKIPEGYRIDVPTGALVSIDRTVGISYDAPYVAKYEALPQAALSRIRADLALDGDVRTVCDVGYGTGAFLQECLNRVPGAGIFGFDVSPYPRPPFITPAPDWVDREWDALTFFDSLEHMPDLGFVRRLRARKVVVSLPWCHWRAEGAEWFMAWKHRKPGEHLWHFEPTSLQRLFAHAGYRMASCGHPEDAVRKPVDCLPNVLTCVFRRR
jgi:hypothetical protein